MTSDQRPETCVICDSCEAWLLIPLPLSLAVWPRLVERFSKAHESSGCSGIPVLCNREELIAHLEEKFRDKGRD